ncbi:MAG: PQQ-binding-like beta-propeller repeat protein [Planctomycetota bacterium]|nr:PQQ-binding-like beta-propeller repeat protein [Planctomycetota bacterium]
MVAAHTCFLSVAMACTAAAAPAQSRPLSAPAQPDAPSGVWNQWRGPSRDGHCPGSWWPERLTEENVKQLWRVELGPSYSGPIVDATTVYTTETVDKRDEVVTAYDRVTGERKWRTAWAGSMKVPFFAAKNGSWIRSTPTVDADSVYIAGMLDVLVCLDKETGEERWRADFVERFETPKPDFGFVCSPLVVGDHVYVQAGASFVKVDKKTGETVWRSMQDGGGMFGSAFSSPTMATIAGKEQLLVQSRTTLAGVAPADGEVLWSQKVRAFRGMNILTPQPYKDSVFVSAYGGRAHLFDVTADSDAFAAKEAWNNRAQGNMTSPVVIGKHAYLYLRAKRFSCVNLESGEEVWRSEGMGDEYWSLVAQGKRLLALTEAGELHLIEHNPSELKILDTLEISEGKTWAHLCADGGQLIVREQDGLAAYTWK